MKTATLTPATSERGKSGPARTMGSPAHRYPPRAGLGSVLAFLLWMVFVPGQARAMRGLGAAATIQASGTWAPVATSGAPSPRVGQTAVWDGSEMLIWGGSDQGRYLGDGAAYNPATNAWRALPGASAPSPRVGQTAVWDGTEMLIWGGGGPTGPLGDGAAYTPATNTWTPLSRANAPGPRSGATAVWDGTAMLVWGGRDASGLRDDGSAYSPQTNTWHPIAAPGAPSPRVGQTTVWDGTEMLIWGGEGALRSPYHGDGGRYNPTTNAWLPMSTTNAPTARYGQTAVWTGAAMLIWGGFDAGVRGVGALGDGAAYTPATDSWRPLPAQGAPSARYLHTAVWTGSAMLIWGGRDGGFFRDGAAYAPSTGAWQPITADGAPGVRFDQTAVWDGTAMLVWGGFPSPGRGPLGDGTAYTPPASSVPHDARYFPQTGYRIDNAAIWDYFQRRGGVPTFGYPTSRTFTFQGFTVQFFQRRIVQLSPDGQARLLNLLDPGLLPYTSFNFSTFPGVESGLVATAPSPTDQPAVLTWVAQHAPDVVADAPVNFDATFMSTVSAQTAFPNGGDASLLPGIDLELWGVPTSQPMMDANNHNFLYLRWQRGLMMYDASCTCTQGVLLADYLKAILTGKDLPVDLAQEAASSPFLNQYDPGAPNWVHNPSLLPNTDLTNAFTPE